LLLITRSTSVEKLREKLVRTVPSQILESAGARRSHPRTMSRVVATPAAPPTDRAQPPVLCCDRRSLGIHVASAEVMDGAFTASLAHPARATRSRRRAGHPMSSPPYVSHTSPGATAHTVTSQS
jgi:hypothetical protein